MPQRFSSIFPLVLMLISNLCNLLRIYDLYYVHFSSIPQKYISYIFLRMGPKWILIPSKVKPPLLRPAKILLRFHKGFDFAMTNTGLVCMYNCIQEKHNCSLCKTCKIQWKETCFLACFQLQIFSGEEQNQSLHCIFCSAFLSSF